MFDRMSKVVKAFTSCARPERFGEPRGFGQRRQGRAQMELIRFFAFQGYGHYARNCRVCSRGVEEQTQRPNTEGGLRIVNEEST